MHHDWLNTAQRIQSIAQAGLTYCQNDYDLERYEELLQLSARILTDYTDTPFEKIADLFSREEGYLTPKVDVRGVIFQGNKLLMVQEKSDGGWTVPGGWADVGFSPSEIAVKEVQEEAGIDVVPERLLAVLDKKCHPHPPTPFYTYKIFIQCRYVAGTVAPGAETKGAGFFALSELPPLSEERLTQSQAELLFDFYLHPEKAPVFD
jgi:ADP-ribose pyrophosphatase YjhB (NUDIX family)